ncbi:T9SS type A sorting domain-containing protein [Polaribacter sp. Q13]|uniref:T9SS type A sorting domain-containing protein n=1 Tax=Polaribacter sp. Q13 TaxID=2806551 RepID=UPI00193C080C|nr:T9SS type A sorting domain-containing protein [Polaribacter sp. Q13]QVY65981.1 T9SS type A sorting domain-containing protein [Polaribacter sp. Q13]
MMKAILCILLVITINLNVHAIDRIADPNNTPQIIEWCKDGITTKISFPEGTYLFSTPISLENNNMIFEGAGENKTILKLNAKKNSLVDAKGSNGFFTKLTFDGGMNQKTWGNAIFRFNKSKNHRFEEVHFTNSVYRAICAFGGYATDGMVVKRCEFSNIDDGVIQIFNRNTASRNGEVIVKVDKVVIDSCIFRSGYLNAIISDNGNDRRNSGDGTGTRYTESTSLSGTEITNNLFEKTMQFHIGMVQTSDVIIRNNTFMGIADNTGSGGQALHFEQFLRNFEIYDNTFHMSNTVDQAYQYIYFHGTEGHKRVTQERPSNTYATWTYEYNGSNERRASTTCTSTGHIDPDCKRQVHIYGPRNVYIAGNTFNASTKISRFIIFTEGENIQIGTKKDGTLALNQFMGGDDNTLKITFTGKDEGCGDVLIRANQGILESNIDIGDVSYDLPAVRLTKPIVVEGTLGLPNSLIVNKPLFYPNPASKFIKLNKIYHLKSANIVTFSGQVVKQFSQQEINQQELDLSNIIPGVYILKMQTFKGEIVADKLIIK